MDKIQTKNMHKFPTIQNIRLEIKSGRILPLTYGKKYDMT